jgi:hypothetical protein
MAIFLRKSVSLNPLLSVFFFSGATTLGIVALCLMTLGVIMQHYDSILNVLSITPLSLTPLCIMTLSIMPLSFTTLHLMTLSITVLCIMAFGIMALA